MKLVDLVDYLVKPKHLDELCRKLRLNEDSDTWLIYMKGNIDIESDVFIFDIQETDDNLIFEKEGVKYIQLFAVDHAIDLIEDDLDLKKKDISTLVIARRLIEYRINDA
jgi:hypothetical protein